ncbi:uncharacterized protein [Dysidea avara]|uniref:uncharacterized protein isoform X2 n=1 Tax=Dysidea avara TaxID=196820 RepID=UPI00332673A1
MDQWIMDHVKVQSPAYDDYSSCPSNYKVTRGCLSQESQRVCSVVSCGHVMQGEIDAIIRRRIAYSVSSTIRVKENLKINHYTVLLLSLYCMTVVLFYYYIIHESMSHPMHLPQIGQRAGICKGMVILTHPQGRGICNTNHHIVNGSRDK